MDGHDDCVALATYSEALDEIWRLRRALAYEALVSRAHAGFKTFPKSRRPIVDDQVDRMQAAARGSVVGAYSDVVDLSLRAACREAGASETLTRWQWEEESRDRPDR